MRHLLAGGGGFIGSHLAELLPRTRRRGRRRRQLRHRASVQRRPPRRPRAASRWSNTTSPRRCPTSATTVRRRARPRQPGVARRLRDDAARDPRRRIDRHTQPARPRRGHTSARFFLASTSEVYGDPLVHPQPETYWGNVSSIGPRSCYDEAKRFSEAITMAYHRVHGLDVRIARIFNTYGERMRPEDGRVVNTFVVQALRGEPITLARRRLADAQLLPRRRRDRRPDRRARRPPHRPDQRRQPRRVHDPRAGRAGRRADRVVERDHHRAAARRARGRPAAAPARHHA